MKETASPGIMKEGPSPLFSADMAGTLESRLGKPWSPVTLGCWQIAPSPGWGNACSEKQAEQVVQTALDHGITAFDTAERYGDGESERRLGKALGQKKDDVIIVSKIWPGWELCKERYEDRLNASLKSLKRDYVDVYLIHWADSYFDNNEKSARLIDCMAALKKSGKARLIGLSNFNHQDLIRLGPGVADFSVNQVPYNLLDRRYEGKARKLCQQAGIAFMAFSPTEQGLLARPIGADERKIPARKKNVYYQDRVFPHAVKVYESVLEAAKESGQEAMSVAIQWILSRENFFTVVAGTSKPAQVKGIAQAQKQKLPQKQLDRLTTASDHFLKSMNALGNPTN